MIIAFLLASPAVGAESQERRSPAIPDAVQKQIDAILQRPHGTYRTAAKEEEAANERIDRFINEHLDFVRAESVSGGSGAVSKLRRPSLEVRPIRWDDKSAGQARALSFGSTWYTRGPQRRIFLKEVDVPTRTTLDEKEAVSIARAFIAEHGFARGKAADTLRVARVLVRKRREVTRDGTGGETQVLFQRVVFAREIEGMEVLNAKQVVDLHADSGEIVGYKRLRWAEVDVAAGGETLPYRSREEVMAELQGLLPRAGVDCTIQSVKPAMYQTADRIVPVIAVQTVRQAPPPGGRPIQETLLVGLVGGLEPQGPGRQGRPERTTRP
jgi:hypothetical protein